MKQIRLLAAVGLSFLVLFVWSAFFTYNSEFDQNTSMNSDEESTFADSFSGNQQSLLSDGEMQMQELGRSTLDHSHNPREVTVDTPLFRMIFSERGGLVKSAVLKHYKEKAVSDSQFKEIVSRIHDGNVSIYLADSNAVGNQDAVFDSNLDEDYLEVINDDAILTFTRTDGEGITLVKSFMFSPNSYLIDMKICVKNSSDHVINDSLVLSLRDKKPDKSSYGFEGPSAFIDGRLKQFKTKDIDSANVYTGHINWIAIEDRYFMSSIIPSSEFTGHVELGVKEDRVLDNRVVSRSFHISPGHQIDFYFSLFMGPKSIAVLGEIGHSMEKAIYFGIFDFIAKPCLWFMNKIYDIVPNYGIAIILLTVFTKLLLWPLGSKGYKSMSEMKKLQPLMTEIRERYKDNKQKMNQEMMTLYRTYKVNPVGGCLPMLLQIPVFFALYRMLYQAIELRHAPFLLWINDLAAPDRLLSFGFSIPFMQPPYGIPVLTIIMGATMLLQQKMSPPPGDPTQAKMMMFMPIVFTFIFINFSSGLVLYWLVNNILSISQQYYIQRKTT